MSDQVYSGSTPAYLLRIRDANRVQLDPSDVLQVLDVFIIVHNSITGAVVARFYLNTDPADGNTWRQADVEEMVPGDKRVRFYLTKEETENAPPNSNNIQVKVVVPDADAPDNELIEIAKAQFINIIPSVS